MIVNQNNNLEKECQYANYNLCSVRIGDTMLGYEFRITIDNQPVELQDAEFIVKRLGFKDFILKTSINKNIITLHDVVPEVTKNWSRGNYNYILRITQNNITTAYLSGIIPVID